MKLLKAEVDSRIRINREDLPDEVAEALVSAFTHVNPAYLKQKRNDEVITETPQEVTWLTADKGKEFSIPRGGMRTLRKVMQGIPGECEPKVKGCRLELIDNRCEGDYKLPRDVTEYTGPELWDHQKEALEALLAKQNCLIRAGTGSGKTTIITAAIAKLNSGELFTPTLIVVQSTRLMEQWRRRICSELDTDKVGQIGDNVFDLRQVTVGMRQSLWALAKQQRPQWYSVLETFGMLVVDEVHQAAAKTFTGIVDQFPAKYRIGVSADETRKDGKEYFVYDMFGAVAYEIKRNELERRGIVHDVEVIMVPTNYDAPWYKKQIQDKRFKKSWKRPDYTKLIGEMAKDEGRAVIVRDLIRKLKRQGSQVLVFSHRVEHCKQIALEHEAGLLLGGKANAKAFEATREELSQGLIRCAVGTLKAISASTDLPSVDVGLATTPVFKNKQDFGQIRGRVARTTEGKMGARIFVLWDKKLQGKTPLQNMMRWNNTVKVLVGNELVEGKSYLNAQSK